MDYSAILFKFRSCMEEIGDALREVSGTNDKYKFTEIASSIKTCAQVFYLGEGMSFDVSHIPGYQNLTVSNFIVSIDYIQQYVHFSRTDSTSGCFNEEVDNYQNFTPTLSYNQSTGVLTVNNTVINYYNTVEGGAGLYPVRTTLVPRVYLIKGEIKIW